MKRLIALVLAAAGLATCGSAFAWGHGPRVFLGFNYGYWGPGPYWGSPWYPAYYYPPAVIVTSPPPPVQYVERPQAPAPAPAYAPAPAQPQASAHQSTLQPGYWYFCDSPQGFYPTVKECPTPWKAVPPGPPPAPPAQ